MALPSPNLDDRTFAQLVEEARARIQTSCPEWSDLSVSDPGMALVEAFAFLTETLIYRLNRVPQKAYIEFLRLLGVGLLPPEAAGVNLVFTLSKPATKPVEIPVGTRVTVSRSDSGGDPPIFTVSRTAVIAVGKTEAETLAHHCDLVLGELAGTGTGSGGLSVTVSRPPIIAETEAELDLVVGVEAQPGELADRVPAREYEGKTYRIWREVENFAQVGGDRFVYIADRTTGTITFAPAVRSRDESGSLKETAEPLAAVPAVGREIRIWYRRGAGANGNVAANTLTVLKDPIPGVTVNNPSAAVGGRSVETLENALLRGPQELRSLQRAVTARDFELLAKRSGAVSRARAYTRAGLWTYAPPGTVEVVLVPFVDEQKSSDLVSGAQLHALQTEEARARIQEALDERRPLGTNCIVSWARYKCVRICARIVANAEEDLIALRKRVLSRLYDVINPLPTKTRPGWRFGQSLRTSSVYDAALAEPGVTYVDSVKMIVEEVPDSNVQCLGRDSFQPRTWYAGTKGILYRSMDDGDGWSPAGRFGDQTVMVVEVHTKIPGLLAVATLNADGSGAHIHVSTDCGETWQEKSSTTFEIADLAWVSRDGTPVLLVATAVGLFELGMSTDAGLVQVFVREDDEKIGYYTVAVAELKVGTRVAVASRNNGGIFLSADGGKGNTFHNIGQGGEDVRALHVQYDDERTFLWGGIAAAGPSDPGKGCVVRELLASEDFADNWQPYGKGWLGGSCVQIGFQGDRILAATYDAGVLWLDRRNESESWQAPSVGCGLPQASREHPLQRVNTLAVQPQGTMLLAGGGSGVFRSRDGGQQYECSSRKEFTDKVTLDPNWLLCSSEHELEVVTVSEGVSD